MTKHTGHIPAVAAVLNDPFLNRGAAFTSAERDTLGLTGRLPSAVLTLDQQAQRAYAQLQAQPTDLAKNVYLEQLHDRNDPLYLGNRHPRVRGAAYDSFIEKYLETASALFPGALLHFEDFGPGNARRILLTYRDRYRIFNDDMQGTGAITLAALLAAVKVTGVPMREQKLLVFGAGTAGVGIADQIHDAMVRGGASPAQATRQVWLIDKQGLLTSDMTDLRDYQKPYARDPGEVKGWASSGGKISLLDAVKQVAPTVLLGTSTVHGAFTREVIETMSAAVERPVVFPISNPTSKIEAMPADVIAWSGGKGLVAVGIPVGPVDYQGVTYQIGQANNALVYPGLGLGIIVSGASKVTDGMLLAAAEAVAGQVDVSAPGASWCRR